MIKRWLIAGVLVLSGSALAQNENAEELDVEQLLWSVVRIDNLRAHIFTADMLPPSHGTGFFVGVDRNTKKGLIFTNRHVIESYRFEAQKLELEFTTRQRRGERVKAEIGFVSKLFDFAVLEFDPEQVKRGDLSRPLILPSQDSPFYDFIANERVLRRQPVIAIGNPFSSQGITTGGEITGIYYHPSKGPFIQTQTPINPGNSGGPLISVATGEVIGINTMTMTEADGTHWSIPIGLVMEEYATWLKQRKENNRRVRRGLGPIPTVNDERQMFFSLEALDEGTLKQIKIHDLIEKAIPGYFEQHGSILAVTSKDQGVELEPGDILLRLNGEVIGGHAFDFSKIIQKSKVTVKLQVLRQGQVLDVNAKFPSAARHTLREEVDFLYLSGLVLKEEAPNWTALNYPGVTSRVTVAELVDSPEVNFKGHEFPPPGTVIAGVSFGGKYIPVKRLLDLKLLLKENEKASFAILYGHRANYLSINGDKGRPVQSPRTGAPFIEGPLESFVMPMSTVITPSQFSLRQFQKAFDFSESGAKTRDWRKAVRCEKEFE